jgi:Xaa-Pro aminopeptidase
LENGDVLIVDWGARHNRYVSDMTRSFLIGKVNEEFKIIAQIVKQANQTARDMIKPGIKAREIDAAARNHIVKSGFGEYFTHRTGHGIGLEEHENPYISQSSEEILNPGMSFTIEPGIYIPGKGGIRIEDNVIVTQDGHETLTSLPRDLAVL